MFMSTNFRSFLILILFAIVFIAPKIAMNIEGAKVVPNESVKFDWSKFKDSCVPLDQLPVGQLPPEGTKICIPDDVIEKLRKKASSDGQQ